MNHCLEITKPRTIMRVNNLIIKYLDIKNVFVLDSLFKMCVNPIESIIIEIFEYLRERITMNEVNHLVGIFKYIERLECVSRNFKIQLTMRERQFDEIVMTIIDQITIKNIKITVYINRDLNYDEYMNYIEIANKYPQNIEFKASCKVIPETLQQYFELFVSRSH